MKEKEPEWWKAYKEANPDSKEEYNSWTHCCSRFWKDWCDCMKEHRRSIKKKKTKK